MVDYAPPWDALPRDSLHSAHEMPLSQVKKSAAALAALLDENKDEQVLKEACLGLCQLFGEGIQNDRIQAILDANVVPKLVALLRPSKSRSVPISVQSAALQVLGNVACGDDRQTQVVIDSNALPCLRALLSSADRSIRKEVCWIVSNITESSHQVQDVLDADILPPLLKLLDNQDAACREDATWVLFNLSSNRDPSQIAYLAEKNGVRALCNLLTCSKELDVLWKGCGTVAAVALKGLRNILISGQIAAASDPNGYNKMASLVAEAHGVERIEALTTHLSPDVRSRARLLLERMFGAEPTTADLSPPLPPPAMTGLSSLSSPPPPPPLGQSGCSCAYQQHQHHHHSHAGHHYQAGSLYDVANNMTSHAAMNPSSHLNHSLGVDHVLPSHLHPDADLVDVPGSTSGSSTDSDPEDDDSDSDLIPPPPAPCSCVLCTDPSPLAERRPRGKSSSEGSELYKKGVSDDRRGVSQEIRQICNFCSGGGRLGDGRAGLAAKLGRAVRLGHPHCIAILLSRMTWSQRVAATEAPALLHPGGGPPDGGVGSSLPAVILAAQLGKPECLGLLLRRCKPDLDVTHGKKRLTALAWAAHKGYMRCCQLLIEYGADPATKCGDAVTALHLASSGGGHIAICKLLIDHKAPVSARSAKKQTPLCLAAQKGFGKVVQLLLERGADPSNEDEGKYTPLHLSASNGFVNCVDLLLKANAKVDAATRNGVTPLHYAVQGGHAEAVKLLIAAGAKVNCNRKPLLLIAADDGNLEVVQILLDAQATIDCKANIKAMLDKDIEVFDYLTPLHLAASKSHHDVVDLLLRRGAYVNEVTTKSGWSALDFAVLNGHAECAVTLLKHGATVTDNCKSIGRNNWTLVQYAAHHGAKDVVRLLIQRLKEQRMNSSSDSGVGSRTTTDGMATGSANADVSYTGAGLENGVTDRPTYEVDESVAHLDYIDQEGGELGDRGYLSLDERHPCQHRPDVELSGYSSHRYDPRSLEGDESGFGTGPGYNNGSASYESTSRSNAPRRRVVKDDRQSTLRAREIKKREAEATEARDRLEEAISQRSVTKLTEAISHVSKLVLHLATTVGNDVAGTGGHMDHNDLNGYGAHPDSYAHAGHVHSPGGGHMKHSSTPSGSTVVSAPLAMEVGLGIEVQKARKILAALLAEEKRLREEKEREAADSKRDNAQQTIRKAVTAALEGGDPRSLARATNRATRTVLERDDAVIVEATAVGSLISHLEKWEGLMKASIENRDLDGLLESLTETSKAVLQLIEQGGQGAAMRVFGGKDPTIPLKAASSLLSELREKRETELAKEAEARNQEKWAQEKLSEAMKSNNIVELEHALDAANAALLSKESELSSTMERAKKVMTKWLKTERRKLRQASNTNDPNVIEAAASAAEKFGLNALQSDVNTAKALALKLREQAETVQNLQDAIDSSDVTALTEIRNKLNSLGMFSEAERARAELERLQRATRARTLLEGAIKDAKACQEPFMNGLNPANENSELKSSWDWPDAQRLCDLSDRARKYGPALSSLCDSADLLAKELAVLGRKILSLAFKSSDARGIAAVIAGYEKSFVNVSKPQLFDPPAGERAIRDARKRLAVVQAMDQASVKAESAQVKVEYALATSRRSAARSRTARHSSNSRAHHLSPDGALSGPGAPALNGTMVGDSETRSPSSLSSDFIEDETSEMDSTLQSYAASEPGLLRGSESHKPNVSRRARNGNNHADDPGMLDALSEMTSSLPGECSHFYLFKEGTTVCCARCGNLRSSSNPEWLARVKRRGNKVPAELVAGSLPTVGSGSDLHGSLTTGAQVNSQTRSPSAGTGTTHANDRSARTARSSTPLNVHQPNVQGFPLTSAGMPRDGSRSQGGIGSHANAQAASMNMMVQLLQQQHHQQQSQLSSKANQNLPRGRGRVHGTQVPSAVDPHVQGLPGMYANGLNNSRVSMPGSLPISTSVPIPSNYASASSVQNLAQPLGAGHPTQVHGYGIGGAQGMPTLDPSGNMRVRSDVGTARAIGPHGMRMNHVAGSHPMPQQNIPSASHMSPSRPAVSDEIGLDFANENFGFDIDAIVDDNPPPRHNKPASSLDMNGTQSELPKMYAARAHPQHNGFYRR